jgi:hypothetical protein
MPKQHLEGVLSKTLKEDSAQYPEFKIWYMKIQNNPLAHKQTPADFIVLTKDRNILIECKETKTDRFTFDRLTQETDLELFAAAQPRNVACILLCFWNKRLKGSDVYLMDINNFKHFKSGWSKSSITQPEAKHAWKDFKIMNTGKTNLLCIAHLYTDNFNRIPY